MLDHVSSLMNIGARTTPNRFAVPATVIASCRNQYEKLGVKIRMTCEVNEEMIKKFAPDVMISATGSRPLIPGIKAIDSPNVVTTEDVLYGNKDVATGSAVVCDGDDVRAGNAMAAIREGCEAALKL